MNGKQLYGLKRLMATMRMGMNPALKGAGVKKKLALNYVSSQGKLTELDGKIYSNTFTPYYPSPAYDRFLEGVLAVSAGRLQPVVTNFAVTARCCCNCWHCSFANREKKDQLSLDQLRKAIGEVQDLGASVIGITGGEPLLRDDLEEIIASIDERSMPIMFTTGFKLTPQRVTRLKEAGLAIPVISLDHHTAEQHDKGRNRKGMFDYALKAVKMFQDQGFYVAVSFVPSRELVDDKEDLYATIEFFKELGINDMRLTSPILAGHLTTRPEELLSEENVDTLWELQRFCVSKNAYPGVFAYDFFESGKYYGCGAGFNYMFIDSKGNLCPCDFTMMGFGNVTERPVAEIWAEMSGHFATPGCNCYADECAKDIASLGRDTWPLSPEESRWVLGQCPPSKKGELPIFYEKMGMKN